MVKTPPASAVDMGLIPGGGTKESDMPEVTEQACTGELGSHLLQRN